MEIKPGMVAQAFNASNMGGKDRQISVFKTSLVNRVSYRREKPCLKKPKGNEKNWKSYTAHPLVYTYNSLQLTLHRSS